MSYPTHLPPSLNKQLPFLTFYYKNMGLGKQLSEDPLVSDFL